MTLEDNKRLKELETKRKLVHKGTGETFEVETWPGGVETWVDDDRYEWTGTEEERSEYNHLYWEGVKEREEAARNALQRAIARALFGGKMIK